jgi:chemotaxis family two-component system response regulator Rcp1
MRPPPVVSSTPSSRSTEILYVEDNPADVELMQDVLTDYPALTIRTVVDGGEALDYLHRSGAYTEANRPDLILLDLSLPGVDGCGVLALVKGDDHLRTIPVIVLSGSRLEEDLIRAYELGANAYVTKPSRLNQLRDVVRAIYEFWCGAAAIPSSGWILEH